MKDIILNSFFGGIVAGITALGYLSIDGPMALLVCPFGIFISSIYGFFLMPGLAGKVPPTAHDWLGLLHVFVWNVFGVVLIGVLARVVGLPVTDKCTAIIETHLAWGWWKCALIAILGGFILQTLLDSIRNGVVLTVLIGAPIVFALKIPLCITSLCYGAICAPHLSSGEIMTLLGIYTATLVGTVVGVNLKRLLPLTPAEEQFHSN